jgi:hypothetical protein
MAQPSSLTDTTIRGQHSTPTLAAHQHVPHVHFVMLDFDVLPGLDAVSLSVQVGNILQACSDWLLDTPAARLELGPGNWMQVFSSQHTGNTAVVKCYNSFLTVDLHLTLAALQQPPTGHVLTGLKTAIAQCCSYPSERTGERARSSSTLYPPVVRGGAFNAIVPTTDGLLIQYDFDELVFHTQSKYQVSLGSSSMCES